jgi:plasmid maintenance system killer protein
MEIQIPDKKLRKTLEDDKERRRHFGAEMAKKILIRMNALAAAKSLADFWPPSSGPERCHELKGDLAGVFSTDLKHPYRLLFEPADPAQESTAQNEKDRWNAIQTIRIVKIGDTHE